MMKQYVLGYSIWGRPILCRCGGTGVRRVLLCAAFHGSEWITALVLERFLTYWERREDLQAAARLWAVPRVNPDGMAVSMGLLPACSAQYQAGGRRGRGRPGLSGDVEGQRPGRGSQSQLSRRLGGGGTGEGRLCSWRPGTFPGSGPSRSRRAGSWRSWQSGSADVLITLHAQGEEIYFQYGGIEPWGAEALGKIMAERSGYRLTSVPPESDRAGYKDWFLARFHKPAYTVECGHGENPLPLRQLPEICQRVHPILETALLGL